MSGYRIWVEVANGLHADSNPKFRSVPGRAHPFEDLTDQPARTILADRPVAVLLETTGGGTAMTAASSGKPPYRVPSMAEIRALPWNGFTAVSTFSGGGGSSLGYRMAGFRVAWASEFIPAAAETYRANASPGTILDTRDIREVKPEDILEATGLGAGEIDLFDGSPPCASFSTAGKREKGWNQVKAYSDTKQRTDDLFWEYARLVEGCRPRVFVAENVSGLVKGTAKGYFKLILARLRECGYKVEARLLDASWLGVPQARQRLIFIGVRDDLGMVPVFPKPLPFQYSVRDALPGILRINTNDKFKPIMVPGDRPNPTFMASGPGNSSGLIEDASGITHDPETGKDITIGRYAIGREWDRLPPGTKSGKYLNLVRPDGDKPAPMVTQAGGGLSTASITHPAECRKLTLGELRRLGGFPDDFCLTGSYEQRWERIGRAVPPVMMAAVATVVRDRILVPLREKGAA